MEREHLKFWLEIIILLSYTLSIYWHNVPIFVFGTICMFSRFVIIQTDEDYMKLEMEKERKENGRDTEAD